MIPQPIPSPDFQRPKLREEDRQPTTEAFTKIVGNQEGGPIPNWTDNFDCVGTPSDEPMGTSHREFDKEAAGMEKN